MHAVDAKLKLIEKSRDEFHENELVSCELLFFAFIKISNRCLIQFLKVK